MAVLFGEPLHERTRGGMPLIFPRDYVRGPDFPRVEGDVRHSRMWTVSKLGLVNRVF